MLISLSSVNESDNARFMNYFSESYMIPKNAYVALINASFRMEETGSSITIDETNNSFQIQLNGLDISTPIIIPVGKYRVSQLADAMTFATQDISLLWIIKFIPTLDETFGDAIVLTMYRNPLFYDETGSKNNAWAVNNNSVGEKYSYLYENIGPTGQPNFNVVTMPNQNSISTPEKIDGINVPFQTDNRYSFNSHYNTDTYNAPPSLNPLAYIEDVQQSFSKFSIQSGGVGSVEVSYGSQNISNDGTLYGYVDPNGNANYYMFQIANNAVDLSISQGTDTIDIEEFDCDASTSFQIQSVPSETEVGVMTPVLRTFKHEFSQVYALPLDFKGVQAPLVWNSYRANLVDFDTLIPWFENSPPKDTIPSWVADSRFRSHYGSFAGTGDCGLVTEFLSGSGTNSLSGGVVTSMPRSGSLFLYRKKEPNPSTAYTNMCVRVNAQGMSTPPPPATSNPLFPVNLISGFAYDLPMICQLGFNYTTGGDDSGDNYYTLLGSDRYSQYEVFAFDTGTNLIKVFNGNFFAPTAFQKDGGETFAGFVENRSYYIGIAGRGSEFYGVVPNGNYEYNLYLADLTESHVDGSNIYKLLYTGVGAATFIQYPVVNYIGGLDTPQSINNSYNFNGSVWDFNISQRNQLDSRVNLVQGNLDNFLDAFEARVITTKIQTSQWYGVPDLNEYSNPWARMPLDTPSLGTFFNINNTTANDASKGLIELGNFNFSPLLQIKDSLRDTSLEASSYTKTGEYPMGIYKGTNTTLLPEILGFSLGEPVIQLEDLTLYGAPDIPIENEPVIVRPTEYPDWTEEPNNALNVNIENLPHRTINGETHSFTKSIITLPQGINSTKYGRERILTYEAINPRWVPLYNSMDIPINNLEVRITDSADITEKGLVGATHLLVEIESRENII